MSLARTISRGAFLNARFGVNPIQKDSRSFGTVAAASRMLASDMAGLLKARGLTDRHRTGNRRFARVPNIAGERAGTKRNQARHEQVYGSSTTASLVGFAPNV